MTTLKAYIDAIPPTIPTSVTQLSGSGALASMNSVDLGSSQATGTLAAARFPALTGDVTNAAGSLATTLATTGVTAGTYSYAGFTVDAKGRITSASSGIPVDMPPVIRTAAVTLSSADYVPQYCDATAGSFNISLAAASTVLGRVMEFAKIDASNNVVGLVPAGTDTVEFATGIRYLSSQGVLLKLRAYKNGAVYGWKLV